MSVMKLGVLQSEQQCCFNVHWPPCTCAAAGVHYWAPVGARKIGFEGTAKRVSSQGRLPVSGSQRQRRLCDASEESSLRVLPHALARPQVLVVRAVVRRELLPAERKLGAQEGVCNPQQVGAVLAAVRQPQVVGRQQHLRE